MTVSPEEFIRWRYELGINRAMLSCSFTLPRQAVREYALGVLGISIKDLISFIQQDADFALDTEDMFQFSSVPDATWRICKRLKKAGDPVLTAPELGKILLGPTPKRNNVAYRKYGENHGKMAARLGLVQIVERHFLLSCVGEIFSELNYDERERLLVRMLLRTPFLSHLLRINDALIDVRNVMAALSDTTYLRRRSSTRNMLTFLRKSSEFKFDHFLDRIYFS